MATSTTMTEPRRKLERLAVDARRNKSLLAAKAVSACIDEAMRELQAVIDAAERGEARRSRCRSAGGPGRFYDAAVLRGPALLKESG